MPIPPRPSAAPVLAVLVTLALAGCSGWGNPARDLAMAAGVTGGEPKPAPDFVSSTRRDGNDYIAIGTDAPKRPLRAKTATEVAQSKAEMEATRASNAARAATP